MITELTSARWSDAASCRPFVFSHELGDHPLLSLDALRALACRLDPDQIESTAADSPAVVDSRVTRRLSEPAGDLLLRTEADRLWFALRNVEADPAYRALVQDVFAEFRRCTGLSSADAHHPEGYVFVGAAGAVTPAHVDHEHNLFFQVTGTKYFTTGSFPDPESEQRTFEAMYADAYGNTRFAPAEPTVHVLGRGDALYVPPTAVHLVQNTDELSISFSLVFHDDQLDRAGRVHALNAHLRGLGLRPRAPGRSALRDRTKSAAVVAWRRSGTALLRRRRAP